jgi:hypothetical protein
MTGGHQRAGLLDDAALEASAVHRLHYVGDKLALLSRAAGWLTSSGRLVADVDLSAIQLDGGLPARRRLAARLRASGLAYNPAATRSPAPAAERSACPTPTSALTTAPAPATPASPPSTRTTPRITDSPGHSPG